MPPRLWRRSGTMQDLDDPSHVGEEWPLGSDSAAILIRRSDIVGASRDKPAIGNLNSNVGSHSKQILHV
jgi:hypothetical protein